MSTTPKAYRYARFSHSHQATGMSLERQADVATEWAQRNGMVIDDAYVDSGVSASRGKNIAMGALWRFRQAVDAKDVLPGSFLLVESVSRFSRLGPDDMRPVLRELVEAGIRVVFFDPSVEVTKENFDSMQVGMVLSIMSYIAKEYADTLGRYKLKAWERARDAMRTTGKAATRTLPYWLTCEATTDAQGRRGRGPIQLHPVYAPIVERIFRDYLAGAGKGEIAQRLNNEGVPPPPRIGKETGATMWRHGLIGRTLANRAVTGTFQPHKEVKTRITLKSGIAGALKRAREPTGDPVRGLYPRVVSDDLFAQAAQMRDQRRARSGAKVNPGRGVIRNILARLATCPVCGSAMMRVNKANRSAPTFICSKAISGKSGACQRVYVPVAHVEAAILQNVQLITASAPIGDPGLQAQLDGLDLEASEAQRECDDLAEDIAGMVKRGERVSSAINAMLVARETLRDELQAKYAALAQRAAATSTNVIRNRVRDLATTLEAYSEGLEQLSGVNAALYECFERVVIDYRSGELVMHWRHGPPPTTVRYYDPDAELVKA